MAGDLFDRRLRALRRDRAARMGCELFLFDRAFEDCLERLRGIAGTFDRALLLGCPSPDWVGRLREFASRVEVADPGPIFASRSLGRTVEEDRYDFGRAEFDLCVTVGTLDTVNEMPVALQLLQRALRDDAPFLGAIPGGDSLPSLRASLTAAGRSQGIVAARTHPRIEPSALAGLLLSAGFATPVVDVDRVSITYPSLSVLIRDLRAMGVTNMLASRPPPWTRGSFAMAEQAFCELGDGQRTSETVEILHFFGRARRMRPLAG
ncbi:MAG TPA: SAM-dependent methyltransferase [Sphingomicrobium sp.]|nr:SAM-dependent methyltransferase [Sphingomicrobium sp.]